MNGNSNVRLLFAGIVLLVVMVVGYYDVDILPVISMSFIGLAIVLAITSFIQAKRNNKSK
ncbi:hypothetical protein COF68_05695 [Bacillus toyonensis]|uniref:hypothetical protein n=1 Tax=Bacillus toyonensis TaxID=155322 RepID=UPI000BFB5A6C|nr:hypothetical protein [Bacillus toyonensis]PHE64333.1 hypothetical protein COF68_05695 [Bacillus toyonensis]